MGNTPQPTEPAVTLQEYQISVPAEGDEDILTVQYQNIEEINASIQFYRYVDDVLTETTAEFYNEWFTASIDEDNNVSYTVSENQSTSPRDAYFKVLALDNETELASSDLVTVTQAGYVPDYATLPFNWAGGTSSDFTALNGVTASGLGSDYASSNSPYLIKFDNTGDYIQVKCDQQPGKVTIDVKMIGGATSSSITIQGSADGETFTDIETLSISGAQNSELTLETTNSFGANDRYVRMVFTKGSNVGVGHILIATYVAPTAQDLTVTLGDNINAIFVFDAADENNPLIAEGDAGTVQVYSGTSIMVSPVVADGYVLESLLVNNEDVTSQMDESGAYTFPMPASDVTITATATVYVAPYTIMFSVNGHEFADAQMTVAQGSALGTLPVPTANIPAGFTFVGWMESPANAYYNATTAPTMVDAATVPAADMILEAVFCISESNPGTWQLSTTAPEAGDQVVLAVNDEGTYYALYGKGNSQQLTVANNVVTNANPENYAWDVVEATYGNHSGLGLTNSEGKLHMNGSSFNVTNDFNNGIFDFTNNQLHGVVNNKYLTFGATNHSFGISDNAENACTLVYFKYIAGSSSNYDYTTLVTNHENDTYIAQSNAETLYGIHYINGVVNTRNAVTNNGKLVVKSGGELDMSLQTLTNTIAANLIIEDGAQVTNAVNAFAGTVFKNIAGTDFGTPEQPTNGGYYLIASPVSQPVVPSASNGFVTENWDLYAYDAAQPYEWRNYNLANDQHAFENIEVHHGYLYASQENTTLSFEGTLNNFPSNLSLIDENDAIEIMPLVYDANNSDNDLKNLTLVGNSYAETYDFYVWDEDEGDFGDFNWGFTAYTLNDEGNGFDTDIYEMLENVAPMDAFFVLATGPNQKVVKYAQSIGNDGRNRKLNVKVSRQNGTQLDNAIVSFAGGSMAKKLYLTDNSTRVYFPISNQDYAVVRVQSEGEQPVNFKAKENGTYTLSVETKNVEMNYLHLIDNMTGADVDLLATPSYTFEAKTSDYASRFRLVFSANSISEDADGDSAFAYFNGTNWTISNPSIGSGSEATLQVVDVMGRVLSSETLSGNAEVNINQPTGVYMLRLVSGDSVKVQKVVVR